MQLKLCNLPSSLRSQTLRVLSREADTKIRLPSGAKVRSRTTSVWSIKFSNNLPKQNYKKKNTHCIHSSNIPQRKLLVEHGINLSHRIHVRLLYRAKFCGVVLWKICIASWNDTNPFVKRYVAAGFPSTYISDNPTTNKHIYCKVGLWVCYLYINSYANYPYEKAIDFSLQGLLVKRNQAT